MPSLKDLKNRIASVKSTQKITSAMKMVAASKFRRAQENVEAARPYAERMNRMLSSLATNAVGGEGLKLMTGTGLDKVHLLVVITSDRGLCGAFNSAVARETRRQVEQLKSEGKTVKLLVIGRKGRDQLRRTHGDLIVDTVEDVGRRKVEYADAASVADKVLKLFDDGAFDVCSVVFNRFKSAISQVVTVRQLVPFAAPEMDAEAGGDAQAVYEFEPDEEAILTELLPRNLSIQVYQLLLESAASEHGARMTAMDNATRNAGDMIGKLTIVFNRTRQSKITTELIEIISGAEAL